MPPGWGLPKNLPPVLPSPDPEPEVVDLSLEDDAPLDTDPLLTPEEVDEIVMEDVESQSPTVIPDPMVPDAPSVDSAVSSYPSREGQPSRPQSLVDRARKSPFADIFRKSQGCHKGHGWLTTKRIFCVRLVVGPNLVSLPRQRVSCGQICIIGS